jgi:hypothetical protein
MGRWLEAVRRDEKNTKTPSGGTDKTDETIGGGVLSVLSVHQMSISENFSNEGETAPGGSVSFVSAANEDFHDKNSEPSAFEIRREVASSLVVSPPCDRARLQAEADRQNEKAVRERSTDRWCACGRLASYAWPSAKAGVLELAGANMKAREALTSRAASPGSFAAIRW